MRERPTWRPAPSSAAGVREEGAEHRRTLPMRALRPRPSARLVAARSSPIQLAPWRLANDLPPPLALLAAGVEAAWADAVPGLAPLPLRSDWAWHEAGEGRGRLRLENRAYTSPAFRRLHLEAAARGDGLHVLHCVLHPWLDAGATPILSMDAVASGDRVTLAVADPCPATASLALPPAYDAAVAALQDECGVPDNNRGAPEWGREIFSSRCVLTRPASTADFLTFARYALSLHRVHLAFAADAVARGGGRLPPADPATRTSTHAAHARYAAAHLRNDKTRRVLAAAAGEGWAGEYMEGLMFDVEPL